VNARNVNPVTRDLLRTCMRDRKWRRVSAIAVLLERRIDNADAARAAESNPAVARRKLNDRLIVGRQFLVRRALIPAVADGVFEKRAGEYGDEYRLSEGTPKIVVGDVLPPAALTAPAATSKTGVSRMMVYQLVRENPGITISALNEKLAGCFDDDVVVARYWHDRTRHASDAVRRALDADQARDPAAFTRKARESILREYLTEMRVSGRIREETRTSFWVNESADKAQPAGGDSA
jgi:hypothetical protein